MAIYPPPVSCAEGSGHSLAKEAPMHTLAYVDGFPLSMRPISAYLARNNFEVVRFDSAEDALRDVPLLEPDLLLVPSGRCGGSPSEFAEALRARLGPDSTTQIVLLDPGNHVSSDDRAAFDLSCDSAFSVRDLEHWMALPRGSVLPPPPPSA
jgi:hypothetical protein